MEEGIWSQNALQKQNPEMKLTDCAQSWTIASEGQERDVKQTLGVEVSVEAMGHHDRGVNCSMMEAIIDRRKRRHRIIKLALRERPEGRRRCEEARQKMMMNT